MEARTSSSRAPHTSLAQAAAAPASQLASASPVIELLGVPIPGAPIPSAHGCPRSPAAGTVGLPAGVHWCYTLLGIPSSLQPIEKSCHQRQSAARDCSHEHQICPGQNAPASLPPPPPPPPPPLSCLPYFSDLEAKGGDREGCSPGHHRPPGVGSSHGDAEGMRGRGELLVSTATNNSPPIFPGTQSKGS